MAYLSIPKGASKHLTFTCRGGCQPTDLTGWTPTSTVYNPDGTTKRVLSPTIPNPATGVVDLIILPADTTAIGTGKYTWDVWVRLGSVEAYRVVYDTLEVI